MSFDMPKAIADGITYMNTGDSMMDDKKDDEEDRKETSDTTIGAKIKIQQTQAPASTTAAGSSTSTGRFVGPLKPEEVRWFYKKSAQDKTWLPLNGRDSLLIEGVYRKRSAAATESKSDDKKEAAAEADAGSDDAEEPPVVVFGGLYRLEHQSPSPSIIDQPSTLSDINPGSASAGAAENASAVSKSEYRLSPIYWEGAPLLLIRGTWFLETAAGGVGGSSGAGGGAGGEYWQPLEGDSLELARKIEQKHLSIFADQRIPEKPVYFEKGPRPVLCEVCDADEEKAAGSGARARWHSVLDVVLFDNSRTSRLWRYLKMAGTGSKLMRGYHTEAKMEDGPHPVTHLVFVVHGIGQKRQRNKIVINSTSLREIADQLIRSHYQNLASRAMFLPVDWRNELQLDEDIIANITPSYLEQIRSFFNESLLDLLYYASPYYGPEVIKCLCRVLNRIYRLYVSNDPGFEERGGRVSIFSHSLGSVISYDILTNDWATKGDSITPHVDVHLEFPVQHLFCVGSPLGVFLAARRRRGFNIIRPPKVENNEDDQLAAEPAESKDPVFRLHNVYHEADPVAYRIEPLVSDIYAGIRPLRIHRYQSSHQPPYETVPPEHLLASGGRPSHRSRSPSPTNPPPPPPPSSSDPQQQPAPQTAITDGGVDSEENSVYDSDDGGAAAAAAVGQMKDQQAAATTASPAVKRSWSAAVFSRLGMVKSDNNSKEAPSSSVPTAPPLEAPAAADVAVEAAVEASQPTVPESNAATTTGSKSDEKAASSKETTTKKSPGQMVVDIPQDEALPYRIDFTLKQGRMEYAYWAAIVSHGSYWSNHDVVMYILTSLYGPPKPADAAGAK